MFRKLNYNKRKMGKSNGATEKASRADPSSKGVADDTPPSVAPPTAPLVVQSTVPSSLVATSSPLATGLPPLTPSRLSACYSLLSSLSRDPLAVSFNLARQSLDFMHQHDSMKGVPSEDIGAILRAAMLDTSRVSIYHAPLFVFFWLFSNFDFFL